MESLSDIDCGLVVLFIKLLSYFLLGFQFLILLNFLSFILNVSADVLLP